MNTPQEVEVWVLIPAIRAQYAKNLSFMGLKQKEIASILKITVPAVSQYINNKRAKNIEFSKKALKVIYESTIRIKEGRSRPERELQNVLKHIKESRDICTICTDYCEMDKNCDICYN